jgi:predicted acyltransferase
MSVATAAEVVEHESPRVERPPEVVTQPLPIESKAAGRVVALDVLRGFDMFWIIGGDVLARSIAQAFKGRPWADGLDTQMDHASWQGLHFYDLIFPTFVFVVGASLVFSLTKLVARGGRAAAVRRVIFRSLALWALGVFYYHGFEYYWPHLRLVGVLQRIAFCYLAVSLLFIFCSPRAMAIVAVSLLVVYWAVMTFVRAPGEPKVSIAEGHNIANWIDANYLPGRKWDNTTIKLPDGREKEVPHDPEGLLSTIPAIVSCLLGVFAGLLLKSTAVRPWRKVVILIVGGAALTALGYLWGLQFPIIKKLWTSSYVLVAGGYAAMALGVFYLLLDVKTAAWPRVPPVFVWLTRPFVWIGMNAITLYLLVDGKLIDLHDKIAPRLVGGNISWSIGRHFGEQWPPVVLAAVAVLLMFLLARFLYKRQIFLRL